MKRVLRSGFVLRNALRPVADPIRHLLLLPEIDAALDGANVKFPHVAADEVVARFVRGHFISVSRRSAPKVDLEQLEGLDDVWALCFRRPRPGWRIFGRFLEQDVFVGLQLHDRIFLGFKAHYDEVAATIPDDWTRSLERIDPLRATDLNAYLSGSNYRDVDEI
jgi:hypothetical protein